MVAVTGPKSTTATLAFYNPPPPGIRAYHNIDIDPVTGERDQNVRLSQHEVVLENLRDRPEEATLDNMGFQLFHDRPSKLKSFNDDAGVIREYYPECSELIKELTGASKVVFFDHTVRRRRPGQIDSGPDKRQPVPHVHVDQTTESAIVRVHRHLPSEEAPELLKRRWQLINIWRPISHPAIDWPLGLCDYRSVSKDDTFTLGLISPTHKGENIGVRFNPNQKWKYFYGLTPDDVVFIKCFDSIQDGSVAAFTPHTGFADPTTPPGTPLRESIELRALVFYD